jgi:hypothetical protein
MITIKGVEIPTQIEDFTIEQFEIVTRILNDQDITVIERYINVLEALKVPDQFINDLTDDELFDIIKSFQEKTEDFKMDLIRTLEVNGFKYEAYAEDEKFILKAKDLSFIEKSLSDKNNFFSGVLAIVFKREDLNDKEHYTSAHIKYKTTLFKSLNARDYYPYVIWISQKINEKIKAINDRTESTAE